MSKDFLTSQIRTNQIIASRSLGSLPSIMVISSSIANGTGGVSGPSLGAGADVFFFVSGSTSGSDLSLFGGNVKISGSITANNSSLFPGGISGSIQRTTDNLPYLVAGTDITISTASNGQITITSNAAGAGASQWTGTSAIYTTSSVAIGVSSVASSKGSDISFFVSGSTTTGSGQAVFGGNVFVSGSTTVKENFNLSGNANLGTTSANTVKFVSYVSSSIIPITDMLYDLGTPSLRWRNMYTGDLHLKNDRGDWTIIEEKEFLSITNNLTGKRFKFVMEEI